MKQTTTLISRLLEAGLWTAGLICLVSYAAVRIHAAQAQSAAISALESAWSAASVSEPDKTLWSPQRIARHEQTLSGAGKPSPLALLSIPAVEIRVAVFDGTSAQVLNLGVGRVPATARVGSPGNLALAGHRDGFFRGLKDIGIGDRISLQHEGGIDDYFVTELSIVDPQDISVLAPTDVPALTLITCYPFYFVGNAPQRFIVRAERKADKHSS